MDNFLLGLAVGILLTAILVAVVAVARTGSFRRVSWGLTVAGRANADPAFAAKIDELMVAGPKPAGPPKPSGEPLRLLALLQSEARLVDFLKEDIGSLGDAQIGQSVREIHRKARQALDQYLTIETVLPSAEGEQVTVPPGFDPSAVRVVGNVTGQPPFTGELQHPGWRVKEIKLPAQAEGQDLFVLQPAEVQLP
jgi:hypothetical protein